jgi:hypothetical protein
MRKNFMLLVVGLVCLFASSLTAFAGNPYEPTSAKFVNDCKTLAVNYNDGDAGGTIYVEVGGVPYGSNSNPGSSGTANVNLSKSFLGTTTFTIKISYETLVTTVTCPFGSTSPAFTPPATQDGRVNVYAPTSVAVYEQVSKLGCDFIIIAIDPQGEYHNFVISQALRDEATEVPANGLLLDGDDYVQVYKLNNGTFQVNAGPYNANGDIYALSLDGCPTKTNSDNNSTYRNGGE